MRKLSKYTRAHFIRTLSLDFLWRTMGNNRILFRTIDKIRTSEPQLKFTGYKKEAKSIALDMFLYQVK